MQQIFYYVVREYGCLLASRYADGVSKDDCKYCRPAKAESTVLHLSDATISGSEEGELLTHEEAAISLRSKERFECAQVIHTCGNSDALQLQCTSLCCGTQQHGREVNCDGQS